MSELTEAQIALATSKQILAFEDLYDSVRGEFAAQALNVEQPFGGREKSRQLGDRPRIVWVPGSETGDLGRIVPAKRPGRNPRPLLTLQELFHCQITGFDASAAEDERAQYHATRLLYDAWLRAVYLAAYGTFEIVSQRWLTQRSESRFGLSIIATGAIEAMIPDESNPEMPTEGASADMVVEILDPADGSVMLSEHQETPEEPAL